MISRFLAALTAGVSAKLPDLRACEAHRGPVTGGEIARLSKRAPAVLAACLGVAAAAETGDRRVDARLRLAAFVVTADRVGLPKDRAALSVVEGLLEYLPGFHPGAGLPAGSAEDLRAENLFSGPLDRTGVALWAVTWRQALRLGGAESDPSAALPTELYAAGRPLPAAADEAEQLL